MDIRRTISVIFNLTSNTAEIEKYHTIFKWIYDNHPNQLNRWVESITPNQIKCKQWLASELSKIIKDKSQYWNEDFYTVEIIGGWFGYPLLDYIQHLPLDLVRLIDLDPFCSQVSQKYIELFNPEFDFKFINQDIMSIGEHSDTRKTRFVINTSCEHMPPMKDIVESRGYIKEKAILILQSNNKTDEPDHINCVFSADELIDQAGCEKIYYAGEMDMGDYTRFMVIGK